MPRKNPIPLLKAFINIISDNNDINMIVLGDGELRDECERISENNKGKIHFYGNVHNITPFLLASDYYISSSLSEGMPTVVMNAMSFGIPSVLSNIKPHIEMFSSIDNYDFFFDANDQIDITNKVNSILNCDYNYLSEQVLDTFNKNFTSLIMSQNYAKEYDSL